MSDQWGQPQQPQNPYGQQPGQYPNQPQQPPQPQQPQQPGGPQYPYGAPQQPQNPYEQQPGQYPGQPQNPYGQPGQPQPQNPYGQPGQPGQSGQYGPPQPQDPYGQVPPQQPQSPQNPYGQPQGPYGQPGQPGQFPGQPGQFPGQSGQYPGQPGQFPGQQPYGYQQPAAGPGNGGKKNMIIGGSVVLAIAVAAGVYFATKSSGTTGGSGTQTQAQSCASWKTEQTTVNNQNPNTASDMANMLGTDVPVMQDIANKATTGGFKTQMTKVTADFSSLRTYLQANPSIDVSGNTTPPQQLITLDEAVLTDVTTLDATCGLPAPDASGTSGL